MAVNNSNISFIDDIMLGYSWTGNTGQSIQITYSYDLLDWAYDMVDHPTVVDTDATGVELLDTGEKVKVVSGMLLWKNVCGLSFENVGTTEGDDTHFVIRKAESITESNDTKIGLVQPYVSGDVLGHADVLFAESYLNNGLANRAAVHELGHVVGLTDVDDVSNAYSMDLSIMSTKYGAITSSSREASTPMIYDIATAQYLYGANDTFESGSSTYDGTDFTGASKAWTLWDAGGTADHFDLSAVSAASNGITLDLRGGVDEEGDVRFSAINKERVAIALDPDEDWEIAIEIEHATGHDGDDVLIGNDAANILHGGEGMDSLVEWISKNTTTMTISTMQY